tara:strand:+ start:254 stop:400 length:147 start_codon:yes stop_codon:yes gene_type:complete
MALCQVLLAHGANPKLKMSDGKTAMDIAKGSSPEVAALLAATANGKEL